MRSATGIWAAWLAVAALAVILAAYAISFPLNHDVGWWLYIAEAMLGGEPLYTSLIEVNPPLFGYLSMLPVALAGTTGMPVELIVELLMLGLIGFVVVWASRLAACTSLEPLSVPLLAAALVVGFIGLPGIDFGQREHLMLVLTTPYVFLLWSRSLGHAVGTREALLTGAAAAAGFALKPHFVVMFLALELWFAYRAPRRAMSSLIRPESIAIVGIGALYVLFVIALHPEYFSLVWEVRELYGGFNPQSRTALIGNGYIVVLAVGASLLWGRSGPDTRLAEFTLVFATAAFLIMVLQAKGWSYHLYPILHSAGVGSVLVFWRDVRRRNWSLRPESLGSLAMLVLLGVALASVTTTRIDRHTFERDRREGELATRAAFFEDLRPGTPVLMLSDRLEDGFPLVQRADVDWVSPFPSLWWIRAQYDRRPAENDGPLPVPQASTALEREYLRLLVRRVRAHEPEYVLVDASQQAWFGDRPFPYLEYLELSHDSRGMLRDYRKREILDNFEVWQRE